MDPATIASSVAALLVPLLKKAGEEFAGDAGKFVYDKAKALWTRLRQTFDGEPQDKIVLDQFERDPQAHGQAFTTALAQRIASDDTLAGEVVAMLAEIKRKAPMLRVVQSMQEAEDVIGVRASRLRSGAVDIRQDITNAKGVTGADLDEIG